MTGPRWTMQHFADGTAGLVDPRGTLTALARSAEELHRLQRLQGRLARLDATKREPDVSVRATFRPGDPESLTDVAVDGLDGSAALAEAPYLALIEAAAHRLLVFVSDFREAKAMDLQPALVMQPAHRIAIL